MTEQNPPDERSSDDTQRLTDSTAGGSTHRYGEAGPTPDRQQSTSPYAAQGSPSYGNAPEPETMLPVAVVPSRLAGANPVAVGL